MYADRHLIAIAIVQQTRQPSVVGWTVIREAVLLFNLAFVVQFGTEILPNNHDGAAVL